MSRLCRGGGGVVGSGGGKGEMKVTKNLILAAAAAYSEEELRGKIKTLLDKVAEGDMYTSVATGDGASYARTERVPVGEALDFFQAVLDYKQTGTLPVCVGVYPVVEK